MSNRRIDLALAFLQSQPASAAAILEQQPIDYVADFLSSVPHTHGSAVLAKMLPQYTARLCKIIAPDVAAALLSEMEISHVAAIMRHSSHELSKKLLGLLPEKTSIACRLLLNYSEEAVGAWMMTNISTIPDDCNIDEALDRIRQEQKTVDSGSSFIVDRNRQFKGVVHLSTLIRTAQNTSIKLAMDKSIESIPARTVLKSIINHPAWVLRDDIPVTNRDHQLIGVLRYVDLRKGLEHISTTIKAPGGANPISGIYEAYGDTLLILFNTVADLFRSRTSTRK